jgi:AcrR family transcriptional regulator
LLHQQGTLWLPRLVTTFGREGAALDTNDTWQYRSGITGSHDARERILEAAVGLLTKLGPRGVSMDTAAAVAGAGKMSAYRHFADREALLAAALRRRHRVHLQWLLGYRVSGGHKLDGISPVERILGMFDRVEAAAGREGFRGCPFVGAAFDVSGADHPIGVLTAWHKDQLNQALASLASAAGLRNPEELGAAIGLVLDGATVQAAVARDPVTRRRVVQRGRAIAEILLTEGQATRPRSPRRRLA